ncbi:PepSY-associated TM helix domain-containing protein [Pseudoalteromonas ulvae]|uniref:Peptidase n=1 Tax=Pseudoalteromonas ulvae TaxID=107327 RepID=A0A244CPA3_PSEDV|nr:PepSY-associated TM helix domain-containing protein [Pseudoalteromonas ulvae]OUL57443.1 peptidase [Pseudoalteromonas ulvae]
MSKNKFKFSKKTLTLLRAIHVYVSMALLMMMIFFAITGITLNHPQWFDGDGVSHTAQASLPSYLTALSTTERAQALPHYVASQFAMDFSNADISEEEISIVQKGPGTYKSLLIDLVEGESYFESIEYGFVAILNDLHKGRNSGLVWSWVLDISAILMLLFSITGALLLIPQQRRMKKSLFYMSVATCSCVAIFFIFTP